MLQRGLAILLSVCMLTGGISDTAYAMSPQVNVQTVSDMQNGSEEGDYTVNVDEAGEDSEESSTTDVANDLTEDSEETAGSGDGPAEGESGNTEGSEDGGSDLSDDRSESDNVMPGDDNGDNSSTPEEDDASGSDDMTDMPEDTDSIEDSDGAAEDAVGTDALVVPDADEQETIVSPMAAEQAGVLAEVTAEDASITVTVEMASEDGRLRYRKKEESEWTYYNIVFLHNNTSTITFAAEADTDYIIELIARYSGKVCDITEIHTEAFAASDIEVGVVDITASDAVIKVSVGAYTGEKQYICARVSYTDSTGSIQTSTGYISAGSIADGSIDLQLGNLTAGTEYHDLTVELDDTNAMELQYAACRMQVSFATPDSVLTAEQIHVTVKPDADRANLALLQIALQDVPEGIYSYTVKCRVVGGIEWSDGGKPAGKLASYNNYADERGLGILAYNSKYEVQVTVDGIVKMLYFTTVPAEVIPEVEIQPLMQGVKLAVSLPGASSGTYTVSAQYYDEISHCWDTLVYSDYNDTLMTEENGWQTTIVYSSDRVRPNAENRWKIIIKNSFRSTVYEKYFTFEAVKQDISVTAESVKFNSLFIRATMALRDESVMHSRCRMFYREKGTAEWHGAVDCTYGYENGGPIYLQGLQEDTEYEIRLVATYYPDDILAQAVFRTLKDTRRLSVYIDNCRYTSAQANWGFESDNSTLDNGYVFTYYRKKGTAMWSLINYVQTGTAHAGQTSLTDLEPGTTYEVLVELKDQYSGIQGKDVIVDAKTEFTTIAMDHVLTAEPVPEEIRPASVTFDVRLTKPDGALNNRMKAVVSLTCADGGEIPGKEIYLDKDNQYRARLVINGLLPAAEYAVTAELYESENNKWIFLKQYDLGEVTTAETSEATSLIISEEALFLNNGSHRKLDVTVQPQEAAEGLVWTSSDQAVATVSGDGTVTAHKAGEADITVSSAGTAADGKEKVSAVCHVTVRDYAIRVKMAEGGYDIVPAFLSRTKQRTLVVYDRTTDAVLADVTWTSSNPYIARISGAGLLEPQNYGQAYIMAGTAEGITLKTAPIKVINEIRGFSIMMLESGSLRYPAIRTAEAVYQVAAGETYHMCCMLSPAYTDQYNSSMVLAADHFNWTSDSGADIGWGFIDAGRFASITIPKDISGPVRVTAAMKDEEYKDTRFTITLDVLKKPEILTLPETYTWLDYSNRLADTGLPEHWQWKEKDTLLYETGRQVFTAYYAEAGYYPYETKVPVHIAKAGDNFPVADGDYSAGKKAYIVQKGKPLQVRINALPENMPTLLYEQYALQAAAKDSGKVSVTEADTKGEGGSAYSITASAKGTYTVSAVVSLKKASFEKKAPSAENIWGSYVLTPGPEVKTVKTSLKLMAVDCAPVSEILFTLAEDSPERPDKVITVPNGAAETIEAIEYEITAANAGTKKWERVIHLSVTAKDTEGNPVENPNITYATSDGTVVKCRKSGSDKLVLTVPGGADGLAGIVATAKDELGCKAQIAVRIKDYTPRVTAYAATVNENFKYSTATKLAEIVLPYDEEETDRIEKISLVESNDTAGAKEVSGLTISAYPVSGSHRYGVDLYVKNKSLLKKKGSLNYYLAVTTSAYGGPIFVPVRIRIETEIPKVTVRQTKKVNVFYTDTMHLTDYDAVSMGLLQISSTARISSVDWLPDGTAGGSAQRAAFDIANCSPVTRLKSGAYQGSYMIRQHKPVLDGSKRPSAGAASGALLIRLDGYDDTVAIRKTFKVQTEYKKPKIRTLNYKICAALGESSDQQCIYTNAVKGSEYMAPGEPLVWKGYSRVICADENVTVAPVGTRVKLTYRGGKDIQTQLTFYSDYWCEPLTASVKIKVVKSKVKLSPATVTLNTVYPMETTQTVVPVCFYNTITGRRAMVSEVRLEGTSRPAQELLDRNLLNMVYVNPCLSVSLNYANAMKNGQIKPGTYKYRVTPYYDGTKLNSVVLTVKVVSRKATVRVKTKGSIDLLKLNPAGTGYTTDRPAGVTVTPVFQGLNNSYGATDAELTGAYADLFMIKMNADGTQTIVPRATGKLKAGRSYALSMKYTIRYGDAEAREKITVISNTFTIKPKQSVPKVTASAKKLTLYASAQGYDKGETMSLYVPHDSKKGYYAIESASGYLDVNKDGRPDLCVTTVNTSASGGQATIRAYVLDADAVKAAAKGTAYRIPVTVQCKGNDGVSKSASTIVNVLVKK